MTMPNIDWNKAITTLIIAIVVSFTGWMALTTISNTTAIRENTVVMKELVNTMAKQNVDINNRVDKHDSSIAKLQSIQGDHETRIKILEDHEKLGIIGGYKASITN